MIAVSGVAEIPDRTLLGKASLAMIRRSPIRHGVIDHHNAYAIIAASEVSYTLAGCPHIKDGVRTGLPVVHPGALPRWLPLHLTAGRGRFLVEEITAARYPRQIVGIWS